MNSAEFVSTSVRTLITHEGELFVSLEGETIKDLAPNEVVIRVEASAVNPTDIGLLLGPADLSTMQAYTENGYPALRASVPEAQMSSVDLQPRIGQKLPVGFEGAGIVVAAGAEAADMVGKTVSAMGGGMYATYKRLDASACTVLPDGTRPEAAASMFVNPLTALSMVETMRREKHTAIVHTAAASNLGQMLVRICMKDGIPLVNVVRSEEQVATLRSMGAEHVVNSSAPSFFEDLKAAIAATGATLAFDATGGGTMADSILSAMEAALGANQAAFSRYGTATLKQIYIYGSLISEPTMLTRTYGSSWAVARYLVLNALQAFGSETTKALKSRIIEELSTTFASTYKRTLSLDKLLSPDWVRQYSTKSTGNKFIVNPSLGLQG